MILGEFQRFIEESGIGQPLLGAWRDGGCDRRPRPEFISNVRIAILRNGAFTKLASLLLYSAQ